MPASNIKDAQAEIASRMRRGYAFADVEAELIDPSDFSDAEKAALWLYGWSYVPAVSQRREADAHIARLASARTRGDREPTRRLDIADLSVG
jgi:hypothetical protein